MTTENKQNQKNNQDLKGYIEQHYADTPQAPLHKHINVMIELMAGHLEKSVSKAEQAGEEETLFLQFWQIRRSKHGDYTAMSKSHSTARQLTTLFNENHQKVSPRMHEYFYQILTKAPDFLQYIEELSTMAKKNDEPVELYAAKNLIYLFKVIMLSVLDLVYQKEDTWVTLGPLGKFTRCFRLVRNNHDDKVKGGVIQFYPSYLV